MNKIIFNNLQQNDVSIEINDPVIKKSFNEVKNASTIEKLDIKYNIKPNRNMFDSLEGFTNLVNLNITYKIEKLMDDCVLELGILIGERLSCSQEFVNFKKLKNFTVKIISFDFQNNHFRYLSSSLNDKGIERGWTDRSFRIITNKEDGKEYFEFTGKIAD